MAEKETPLGMEFMRWQNAPSLSGGAFDDVTQAVKRFGFGKALVASGAKDWLNNAFGSTSPSPSEIPNSAPPPVQNTEGVAPAPAMTGNYSMSPAPAAPATPQMQAAPMPQAQNNVPANANPLSNFDQAMQRFGFKPISFGG